ncbi:MAG TPA: RHS repeat-associated core domain-containing protein, partial [Candidatus Didemnitutus sp.]|nr:RHS repeat-associated core domain-containing protein [Candidatus Didemnitutus sp.]
DNLTYTLQTNPKKTNRLRHITDACTTATAHPNDLEGQPADNYVYDEIGNLTSDQGADVTAVFWTPANKIDSIVTDTRKIGYTYDAMGNRVRARTWTPSNVHESTTWYLRDAQGQVLSIYKKVGTGAITQTEVPLYGSDRLGMIKPNRTFSTSVVDTIDVVVQRTAGERFYELKDHLGNVRVVITDEVQKPSADVYLATVASQTDYYPFGMIMESRSQATAGYRYGFNGKENDNDVKGTGNQQDYGARIYDPRVARFFSIDPLASNFPDWSPYVYANDNPIALIDENGEFGDDPRGKFYKTMGAAAIKAITTMDINANRYKALYVLAQYRNENGFNLNTPGNNPFNIKGRGDAGQITYMTTEYVKGKKVQMPQGFANFSSLQEGFSGYLKLLEKNFPRANEALTDNKKTIEDFANGLMKGRVGAYATSPTYAKDLKTMLVGVVRDFENDIRSQINKNNLSISKNNERLSSKSATSAEKSAATKSNIELNSSNQGLNNDLQQLQDFKKNEGLD